MAAFAMFSMLGFRLRVTWRRQCPEDRCGQNQ